MKKKRNMRRRMCWNMKWGIKIMLGLVLLSLSLSLYNRRKLFLFFSFNTIIYDERFIGVVFLLLFSFLFFSCLIITTVEMEKLRERERGRKWEEKTIKFYIWAMSRKETFFHWTFFLSFSFYVALCACFVLVSFFRAVNAIERKE